MIVYHVAIRTSDDYVSRRETHRRDHLERLQGLRAMGIVIAGGPSPDGRQADLVYRLQQPAQLKPVVEEDPYWQAGAWTGYEGRSFAQFVEPWIMPPVVTDGSRLTTIVEGQTADHDMAQFALIEMRGAGRVHFGGFFEDGHTVALVNTPDAATALGWFTETGFWAGEALRARPYLHVL